MVEGDQTVTNRHEILQLLPQWGHDQPSFLCERCFGERAGGSMEAVRAVSQGPVYRGKSHGNAPGLSELKYAHPSERIRLRGWQLSRSICMHPFCACFSCRKTRNEGLLECPFIQGELFYHKDTLRGRILQISPGTLSHMRRIDLTHLLTNAALPRLVS